VTPVSRRWRRLPAFIPPNVPFPREAGKSASRRDARRSPKGSLVWQRAWIALTELGDEVAVAVADSAEAMETAVRDHDPELIVPHSSRRGFPRLPFSVSFSQTRD
jgi:hypothetical protein